MRTLVTLVILSSLLGGCYDGWSYVGPCDKVQVEYLELGKGFAQKYASEIDEQADDFWSNSLSTKDILGKLSETDVLCGYSDDFEGESFPWGVITIDFTDLLGYKVVEQLEIELDTDFESHIEDFGLDGANELIDMVTQAGFSCGIQLHEASHSLLNIDHLDSDIQEFNESGVPTDVFYAYGEACVEISYALMSEIAEIYQRTL